MAFGVVGRPCHRKQESSYSLSGVAAGHGGEEGARLDQVLAGSPKHCAAKRREALQRLLILLPREDAQLAVAQRHDVVVGLRRKELARKPRRMDQGEDMLGPVLV